MAGQMVQDKKVMTEMRKTETQMSNVNKILNYVLVTSASHLPKTVLNFLK